LQQERGVRICDRNNSADTKVSEAGGEGDAPGAEAEIPLQPLEKTMVRQAVPLQPMDIYSGADMFHIRKNLTISYVQRESCTLIRWR